MARKAGLKSMDSWLQSQYGILKAPGKAERTLQGPQENQFNAQGEVGSATFGGGGPEDQDAYNYRVRYDAITPYYSGPRSEADVMKAAGALSGKEMASYLPVAMGGESSVANPYDPNKWYTRDADGTVNLFDGSQHMANEPAIARRQAMWNYFSANNPAFSTRANDYMWDYVNSAGTGGYRFDESRQIEDKFRQALGASYYDKWMTGAAPTWSPTQINASSVNNSSVFEGANSQTPGAQSALMRQENFAEGGMVGLGTSSQQSGAPLLALRYAGGGQVGQPGMAPPGGAVDPKMAEMQIKDTVSKNPQVAEQIRQVVIPAMQQAGITPEEAQQIAEYAKAAMHNPAIWPQLRSFGIQQGIPPQMIPEQYDPGLIYTILLAAQAMQQSGTMGGVPMGTEMPGAPGQPDAGMLFGPGTGTSDSIPAQNLATGGPVKVSTGEYIIPKHVVDAKGKEFFDNLLRKYAQINGGGGDQ